MVRLLESYERIPSMIRIFGQLQRVICSVTLCLTLLQNASFAADSSKRDDQQSARENFRLINKTLVVWTLPENLVQQGAGVLTLQEGGTFDSIVMGEVSPSKWMAGSEFFRRTQREQSAVLPETLTTSNQAEMIRLAAVYDEESVTIYRNRKLLTRYPIDRLAEFGSRSELVAGLRWSSGLHGPYAGVIDEIRLYDRALNQAQINALSIDEVGEGIVARFTFNQEELRDECGLFLNGELSGGAEIRDGKLRLDGKSDSYFVARLRRVTRPSGVQAGFFTPRRTGLLWDTWVYYYQGTYYQYYLAGPGGRWDRFELMTSNDGVHWEQAVRTILEPRPGTTWMGTGHILEAPDFAKKPSWIMNFSEWHGDRQDIMFCRSDDLIHWEKVSEDSRFRQDSRWYKPDGRWDCIDSIKIGDTYYGYFTADPNLSTESGNCGFGTATSIDGVHWQATEPVKGNIAGEFGGIQKIRDHYYITLSEGRIARSLSHLGPFVAQTVNPNMFGEGFDMYFPRFFHNPPREETLNHNGVLVNHFYTNGPGVYSAPLKGVEVDDEGILRLKWWPKNELLKKSKLNVALIEQDVVQPIQGLDLTFDSDTVAVIEWESQVSSTPHSEQPVGIYFQETETEGHGVLINQFQTVFGKLTANGDLLREEVKCDRGLKFDERIKVRAVLYKDMLELYVDDYLMMLKRFSYNGNIGFVGNAKNVSCWGMAKPANE